MKSVRLIFVIVLSLSFLYTKAMAKDDKGKNMNNPFGVLEFLHWDHSWNKYKYHTQQDLEKAARLMKEAGVGWVRMDFLWQDIEAKQGEFNFAKYDNIVELLIKYDINILGILNYSSPWASAKWNQPPEDPALFVNYVSEVVSRYKDKVNYWELWNEPDSATYWEPQDSLKSYCILLKYVYAAAKKANPACKVLNGGLANGLSSINHLYDAGGKGYFDILNLHYFESPVNKNGIKAVIAYPKLAYKIMERNGDADKLIWLTEIGCPGVSGIKPVANWWMGKNPGERQQAEWVKEVYSELLKNKKVEKIFWAFFRDTNNHWGNGTDYFGLVRWDFSKKSAFTAYQKCFKDWKSQRKPFLKR
jgi:polysaccharide biosynthesis protein PslG